MEIVPTIVLSGLIGAAVPRLKQANIDAIQRHDLVQQLGRLNGFSEKIIDIRIVLVLLLHSDCFGDNIFQIFTQLGCSFHFIRPHEINLEKRMPLPTQRYLGTPLQLPHLLQHPIYVAPGAPYHLFNLGIQSDQSLLDLIPEMINRFFYLPQMALQLCHPLLP